MYNRHGEHVTISTEFSKTCSSPWFSVKTWENILVKNTSSFFNTSPAFSLCFPFRRDEKPDSGKILTTNCPGASKITHLARKSISLYECLQGTLIAFTKPSEGNRRQYTLLQILFDAYISVQCFQFEFLPHSSLTRFVTVISSTIFERKLSGLDASAIICLIAFSSSTFC